MAKCLTAKQRKVCDLMAKGLTNKEIAAAMGISECTVKSHRIVVFEKMNVRNAVELVRKLLLVEGKLAL